MLFPDKSPEELQQMAFDLSPDSTATKTKTDKSATGAVNIGTEKLNIEESNISSIVPQKRLALIQLRLVYFLITNLAWLFLS